MKAVFRTVLTGMLTCACIVGMALPAQAADAAGSVQNYTEAFSPVNRNDATLTVRLEAMPDKQGYVYILPSFKGMKASGITSSTNLDPGAALVSQKQGDTSLFAVKAKDPTKSVTLTAQFACEGFYKAAADVPSTGQPATPVDYKFVNKLTSGIGNYQMTIELPRGNEFMTITTPAKYAGYTLSMKNGLRAISVSKKAADGKAGMAPAASAEASFNYGVPYSSKAMVKVILWVVIALISAALLYAEIRKYLRQQQAPDGKSSAKGMTGNG